MPFDRARASLIINANAPVGTGGIPGTQLTALPATAMKVRLNSTSSTAAAAGTEITGSGYTAGGQSLATASTSSTNGSNVTLPAGSALSWTNASGSSWSIVSVEVTDGSGGRVWYGDFTGQPISVANGNTFQIAIGGITIGVA